MSKVWDAIKKVERERELADRNPSGERSHPIAAYLTGVRRRCRERLRANEPRTTTRSGLPPS